MKKKSSVQACLLSLVVGMLLAGGALAQEEGQPQWLKKAEAAAKALANFVPAPVAGLVDHLPWEDEYPTRTNAGFGEGESEPVLYVPARAETRYTFDDPALVQRVQALEKEYEARVNAFKPDMTPQETEKAMKEMDAAGKRWEDLRRSPRSVWVTIAGNETPWCGGGGALVRSAMLKGHPLYRSARNTGDGYRPENICLVVYVGPEGFKNSPVPKGGEMRGELKNILVKASIASTPQTVKADEAIVRQLLEKVDYDGLAKLLTP